MTTTASSAKAHTAAPGTDLILGTVAPRRQRRAATAGLLAAVAVPVTLLGGCAASTAASPSPSPIPINAPSPSASPTLIGSEIVGYWHRAQTCTELLPPFEAAELDVSHRGWLQGNFYAGTEGPATGDVCAGAQGPLEHSHSFTETGEFASHDHNRQQVDNGDYTLADADTLSFPSHSAEFGYAGDIRVDFAVDAGIATFRVNIPGSCDDTCRNAHAWALSAFASGPWAAGAVP
jgi:hypothetical protein